MTLLLLFKYSFSFLKVVEIVSTKIDTASTLAWDVGVRLLKVKMKRIIWLLLIIFLNSPLRSNPVIRRLFQPREQFRLLTAQSRWWRLDGKHVLRWLELTEIRSWDWSIVRSHLCHQSPHLRLSRSTDFSPERSLWNKAPFTGKGVFKVKRIKLVSLVSLSSHLLVT